MPWLVPGSGEQVRESPTVTGSCGGMNRLLQVAGSMGSVLCRMKVK